MINLVEMCSDDMAFDQPCKYGNRVEGHAVYCHNDKWENSPRKCRRTWYYGRDEKGMQDEDCKGFEPNPDYIGDGLNEAKSK